MIVQLLVVFIIVFAIVMLVAQLAQPQFLMSEVEPTSRFYSNPDDDDLYQSLSVVRILVLSFVIALLAVGLFWGYKYKK